MVKKYLKKYRLFRSPYMLATVGGFTAIVLDFIWSGAEILKHMGWCDITFEVHILLITLFPICGWLLIFGAIKYVRNGYVRKEMIDEKTHREITNLNKGLRELEARIKANQC